MNSENKDVLELEGINEMGYGLIPKIPMKDRRLSIESKAIYAYMSSYAGGGKNEAFPSIETLCNDLNISEKRLRKYREELVAFGYIEIERVKVKGKHYTRNNYKIKSEINLDGFYEQSEYSRPKQKFIQTEVQFDTLTKRQGNETLGKQNVGNNINSLSNNNSNTNSNSIKDITFPTEMDNVTAIFNHYNSKGIVKHTKILPTMEKEIKARLKVYPLEIILKAIDNYHLAYRGDQYYWTVKYTLAELMRDKDLIKFIDESEPLTKMLKFDRNNNYNQKTYNKQNNLTPEELAKKESLLWADQ